MSDVTRILEAVQQGEAGATEQLLPLVYSELRRLAAHRLSQEAPGQTLQATALVHEAFLRLVGNAANQSATSKHGDTPAASPTGDTPADRLQWECQAHFFAAAAEAMRRILIENARRKQSAKRGGDRERIELDAIDLALESVSVDLIALDEALTKLEVRHPVKARVVKLRYFAGMSIEQTAVALGISQASVKRYWSYSRAWLAREMSEPGDLD